MLTRVICILVVIVCCGMVSGRANALTIEKEPTELIELRQKYTLEKKEAVSPSQFVKLQREYEIAKRDAMQSGAYINQRKALENTRDEEIRKINASCQASLEKLEQDTLTAIDRKYQQDLADFEVKAINQTHADYINALEKLEKALIAKNDLAGALMVQTERKKQLNTPDIVAPASTPMPSQPTVVSPQPAAAVVPPPVPKAVEKKYSPQTYSNSTHGIAGSTGNEFNNVYTFNLTAPGQHAKLSFNAYGKKSNDSHGEVYLSAPNGTRSKVAEWSPDNLKAINFYGVKSAQDVEPVEADITEQVTAAGTYQIQFKYKDGDEALNIYQVKIDTW